MKLFTHQAIVFLLAVLIALLSGCSESSTSPPDKHTTIPYTFSYPDWVKTYLEALPEPMDNRTTVEGVTLGRMLFYDKRLSGDNTMACATCHKQEFAFNDDLNFSKGIDGSVGTRNAMSINNLAWSSRLFWDGRSHSLEAQAHDPVVNPIEMKETWKNVVAKLQQDSQYPALFYKAFGVTTIDSNLITKAIAQFERTLVSFSSRFDRYHFEGVETLNESEKRGYNLFFGKADCNHCHSDVLLTDNAFRNNGLDLQFKDKGLAEFTGKATDNGKFKVPTLRNIEKTAPYMHDSRFKTLREVVDFYSDGIRDASPNLDENMEVLKKGLQLSEMEKNDLTAFLASFTDNNFLDNPQFAPPK